MGFQKGHKKTGGRQKGSKNKFLGEVYFIAEKTKCNPLEILCYFATGNWKALGYESSCYHVETPNGDVKEVDIIKPEMRLKAASDACKYLFPQKKAVEVTGEDGKALELVVKDYTTE